MSSKKGSKNSRKTTTRDDSESEEEAKDNESDDDNGAQSDSVHEDEEMVLSLNLDPNEDEAEGIEESNLDERTPRRSSIPKVVSESHSKKRPHSFSSEPRRIPPSKLYQTTSLVSKKSHKSCRESQNSITNNKTKSHSVTPQVIIMTYSDYVHALMRYCIHTYAGLRKTSSQPKILYIDSIASAADTGTLQARHLLPDNIYLMIITFCL